MLDKLAALERISRQLDPDQDTRTAMLEEVQDYVDSFLNQLPETKTFVRDEGRNGFGDVLMGENPAEISQLLALFRREIDTTGINPASGGQCGYIPGGGLYPSALGDYLADVSNRYSGVSFAGPGAAHLEMTLVEWLCKLVGYSDTASGDLTSGGSIATLSAVVTARDAHGIGPASIPDSCIYLTAQAHHCIDKSLHVAGLKDLHTRIVPMDRRYRMDVGALKQLIDSDRKQGLNPWMVVASAGTTDTGAVDPLREIGKLARDEGLWFHLDAAYGGFFLLCEEGRELLRGVEQADSIVLDPHKALCLPYGSGAVLIKDGRLLVESNRYYADYMQDAKQPARDLEGGLEAATSPADFSLELSRPFRGPRMWFPLKLFGLKPFRASLAEKIWLARYFHQQISQMDGFEAGPNPDLSIVTYRYLPKNGDANEFNKQLLDAVLEDGRIFISSTMIDGNYTLRLAVLHFRTHLDRIDYLLNLLQTKARELDG